MSFERPQMLVPAALLLLAALALFAIARQRRSANALRFSNLEFLIAAARPPRWPARALFALWIAAVALLALSLAGPRAYARVPVRDAAVILCIDTSGSMAATDVQPTRAAAASAALGEFLRAAPQGVAAGIIAFDGDAQVVMPLSRDRNAVLAAIPQIPEPNGPTAIGEALGLAQRALPRAGKRVVVLITDGENNTGIDPLRAARALAAAKITLYAVGIGTNSGALVPGTLAEAGIDVGALRAYAQATGGTLSRVSNARQLREALSQLGRTTAFKRRSIGLSHATALAGGLLAALAFLSGAWTKSM